MALYGKEPLESHSHGLARACEGISELGCNGALTELYGILSEHLKSRAYPGWFAGWPDKEAQARRLRSFQPMVVPGLLQTEAYARAILSTRVGVTGEELDEAVAARIERCHVGHAPAGGPAAGGVTQPDRGSGTMTDMNRWRKSTYSSSNGGNCTEVAAAPGAVLVRDSKDPGDPRLIFSLDTWRAFAGRVKATA